MHPAAASSHARGRAASNATRPPPRRGDGWGLFLITTITTLVLGFVLVTLFAFSMAVIGARSLDGATGLIEIFTRDLPSPEAAVQREVFKSTFIYDRSGEQLYEIFDPNGGRRTIVPISEIPQHLIAATVATEDANFYENPGFDLKAMFRALWQNYRGQGVYSGASTITQQLIRNALFDPAERFDRSIGRKVKEIVLAYRLSQLYSKDEILERYLNEINYGNLAYGIEAASHTYFDKSVNGLTLAEASFLAGLPQSPNDYNPFLNFRSAKERQAEVLGLMVRQGYISEKIAEAALKQELKLGQARSDILAPHFVMYVRELLERKYGRNRLFHAGFRVYTTLDMKVQRAAEAASKEHVAKIKEFNANNAAVLAINPNSGEIIAMVGSVDFWDKSISGQVNMTTAQRQPGSTLKPFTYAAAFARGTTSPGSIVLDEPTQFRGAAGEPYIPRNPDGTFRGPVTIRYALANSLNIPALKTLNEVGVSTMVNLAKRMGITTLNDTQRYGLTVTLGGGEARMIDLVYAYTPFANGGLQIGEPVADPKPNQREFEPASILKIVDAEGRVLEEYSPRPGKRIISPQVAWMVTDILADDESRSDTYGRNSPLQLNRPAAAKTGTTDNNEDSWTIGYTPDLVVGVWVGNAGNQPMRVIGGLAGAGAIWNGTMTRALKDVAPRPFARPSGLVQAAFDPRTGMRPGSGVQPKTDWFLESNVPTQWTQPAPPPTPTLIPVKPSSRTAPTQAQPAASGNNPAGAASPVSAQTPTQMTPTTAQQPTAPAQPQITAPLPAATQQQAEEAERPLALVVPTSQARAAESANVVTVPNVIGMTEAEARQAIQNVGLTNTYTNFQGAGDVTDKNTFNRTGAGRVLSQSPQSGTAIMRGATVYIAVRRN